MATISLLPASLSSSSLPVLPKLRDLAVPPSPPLTPPPIPSTSSSEAPCPDPLHETQFRSAASYYHIENPTPSPWSEVVSQLTNLTHGTTPIRPVPMSEWVERLETIATGGIGATPTVPTIAMLPSPVSPSDKLRMEGIGSIMSRMIPAPLPPAVKLLDFFKACQGLGEKGMERVLDTRRTRAVVAGEVDGFGRLSDGVLRMYVESAVAGA